MLDISKWHTTADNPPDRDPLLCYSEVDGSIFLGFTIHPYNKEMNVVNWYKQTGLHEWKQTEYIVTRWVEINSNEAN